MHLSHVSVLVVNLAKADQLQVVVCLRLIARVVSFFAIFAIEDEVFLATTFTAFLLILRLVYGISVFVSDLINAVHIAFGCDS